MSDRRAVDGRYQPNISKETTDRLVRFCKAAGITAKGKFVEQCINEKLDKAERELYEKKSKEELINLLLNKTS